MQAQRWLVADMATRAILHFLKKEKESREPNGFKSLTEINDVLLFDLGLGPQPEGCCVAKT